MIGNIIEYVHSYGYFDFQALPFGGVDALVLAQFVYLKLENIMGGIDAEGLSLKEIRSHEDVESLFTDPRWEQNNRDLFWEMCDSKRYGDMKCLYCADRLSTESETQFMAITCVFPDGSTKIVYRGTDETLVGWKEDFNMAFQYPVPGQFSSKKYLEYVAGQVTGSFDILGHSKGGNLAVYAAMNVSEDIQNRITNIYNLDGPGFRTEVYTMGGFEQIEDKITKIIPHSSVVGMLLENHGEYRLVGSKNIGFLQHDPFSWLIDRIDFVYVKQKGTQRMMDTAFNEWLMSLTKEEVEAFVNALYQIVEASEATDLISFTKNWTKSIAGMAGAIQHLDEESKNNIHHVLKSLAKVSTVRIKEETESFFQNKIGELNQRIGKEGSK